MHIKEVRVSRVGQYSLVSVHCVAVDKGFSTQTLSHLPYTTHSTYNPEYDVSSVMAGYIVTVLDSYTSKSEA